jgi:hypothetical protein
LDSKNLGIRNKKCYNSVERKNANVFRENTAQRGDKMTLNGANWTNSEK